MKIHVLATEDYILLSLSVPFSGPWVVQSHVANDVSLEHPVTKPYLIVDVSRCTVFAGTAPYAYIVDQHTVDRVCAWRGEPLYASTMEFALFFADGPFLWVPWTTCGPVADCIDYHLMLPRLRSTGAIYEAKVHLEKDTVVTTGGDHVYVDLDFWYGPYPFVALLGLPDASRHREAPSGATLVTWQFFIDHPALLPTDDLTQCALIIESLVHHAQQHEGGGSSGSEHSRPNTSSAGPPAGRAFFHYSESVSCLSAQHGFFHTFYPYYIQDAEPYIPTQVLEEYRVQRRHLHASQPRHSRGVEPRRGVMEPRPPTALEPHRCRFLESCQPDAASAFELEEDVTCWYTAPAQHPYHPRVRTSLVQIPSCSGLHSQCILPPGCSAPHSSACVPQRPSPSSL